MRINGTQIMESMIITQELFAVSQTMLNSNIVKNTQKILCYLDYFG
jgi:hypothetical protein